MFTVVLFVICGASLPQIPIPHIDPRMIADDPWFKLAKDTGLIYVSFVIPLVAIGLYGALLQFTGQFLAAMLLILSPRRRSRPRMLNAWALEPLAILYGREDFELSDLIAKAAEATTRYKLQQTAEVEGYQRSLSGLTRNSQEYMGDFLAFLLAWALVFRFFSHAAWIRANQGCFWPVVFILLALIWFAWFRVSRVLAIMPSLQIAMIGAVLRTNPETAAALEITAERRTRIRDRIEELLRRESEDEPPRPSILRFLKVRLGWEARPKGHTPTPRGRPFPSLYSKGLEFSLNRTEIERYDGGWLPNYFAYCYYRLHDRLSAVLRVLFQMLRHLITGAPPLQ
ncbi:MAG: hypothetical protein JST11_18475 [Acidobacteria bacterium]|nr:hypothetical protein [Acidobacteriota bacterium]